MAKKVVENFHAYCEILENAGEQADKSKVIPNDHFNVYRDLKTVYHKKGEVVFYQFLNKVYDSQEKQIMEQLPLYLANLEKTKFLDKSQMTQGVSKFLKAVPDLANDYPKLAHYLSHTLFTLIDLKAINVADLVWVEP